MTKAELLKEIQSLHLRVAACDKYLAELTESINKHLDIGAYHDYRRVETNKYTYLTQVAKLKQQLKHV